MVHPDSKQLYMTTSIEVTELGIERVQRGLSEKSNETHTKYCSNCGKKIEKPVLHEGYAFCSDQCLESFIGPRRPHGLLSKYPLWSKTGKVLFVRAFQFLDASI